VNRYMLAKDVMFADAQARGLPFVFEVLGRVADHAAGVKFIMGADGDGPGQMDVWPDPAMRTETNVLVDDHVRPNHNRGIELGFGVDDGGGVNHV